MWGFLFRKGTDMEEALEFLLKKTVRMEGTKCIGDYLLKDDFHNRYQWKNLYFRPADVRSITIDQRGISIRLKGNLNAYSKA